MKVLFLSAWYPNRNDDMDGIFVRKHAMAAARFNRTDVLFIKGEDNLVLPEDRLYEYVFSQTENVREHYFYYSKPKSRIRKVLKFFRVYRKAFLFYKKQYGKPDVVHVNVLTRHGVAARLLHLFYRIPYVITEHWGRYFRQPFKNRPWHKWMTRNITRHAACVMPVSYSLAKAMRDDCGLKGSYKVVRNVVDDFFFLPAAGSVGPETSSPSRIKTMIHVSAFDEKQKNNFGLLRAVKELEKRRNDFRLLFVGTGEYFERTVRYAEELGFAQGRLHFAGKMQPPEVKRQIEQSDFMVLFTNYETASVVLYESISCGKPVVTTRVDAIPEIINDSNGIMVEAGDEAALTDALDYMLDHFADYDSLSVQQQAKQQFSFDVIGKIFSEIYQEAVKRNATLHSREPGR